MNKKIIIFGIVFCLLLANIAFAAVNIPKYISVQGRLTDYEGGPITGTKNFKFEICQSLDGSDCTIYTETKNVYLDQNGVFSVLVGQISQPFDKPYWLKVSVDNDPLTPRVQLTSSGYAYTAAGADDFTVRGNIYINSTPTTTSAKLHIVDNTANSALIRLRSSQNPLLSFWEDNVAQYTITLDGGKLLFGAGTGASTPQATQITFDGSGNIGIGTTTPGAKLEVYPDSNSGWKLGEHPSYTSYSALWTPARGDAAGSYVLLADDNTYLNAKGSGGIYFREDNNNLMTISNGGDVTINKLTSCDTIDTDSTGKLKCGTDATGNGGSGTVTSVGMSVPSFLSVTGSPITGAGTLAVSYSGTALPVVNGGTGATTAANARTNLGTDAAGTARPASDVYAWAKASSKPTYTASEVSALASGGTAVNSDKVDNMHAADLKTYISWELITEGETGHNACAGLWTTGQCIMCVGNQANSPYGGAWTGDTIDACGYTFAGNNDWALCWKRID